MEEARKQAFELLSDAQPEDDGEAETLERLKRLLELLVHRQPGLLPELITPLVQLHANPSAAVRRYVAQMLEEIGTRHPYVTAHMGPALLLLIEDPSAQVAKQALVASTALLRATFQEVLVQGLAKGHVEQPLADAWVAINAAREAALGAAVRAESDGVRLHAVKLVEASILLFTADPSSPSSPSMGSLRQAAGASVALIVGGHPLLDLATLGQQASQSLAALVSLLRGPAAATLPAAVAIVVINSLSSIARQRPALYGKVLPGLLALGPDCASLPKAQAPSVVYALKAALLALLKSPHASAAPWRERLAGSLRSMNAEVAMESALRQLNGRAADREPQEALPRRPSARDVDGVDSRKRVLAADGNGVTAPPPAGSSGAPATKRPRGADSSAAAPADSGAPVGPVAAPAGDRADERSPLEKMVDVLAQLVARGEKAVASVTQLINSLPPDVLADVVIAYMHHLPASLPPLAPVAQPPLPTPTPSAGGPGQNLQYDPRRDPRRQDPRRDAAASTAAAVVTAAAAPRGESNGGAAKEAAQPAVRGPDRTVKRETVGPRGGGLDPRRPVKVEPVADDEPPPPAPPQARGEGGATGVAAPVAEVQPGPGAPEEKASSSTTDPARMGPLVEAGGVGPVAGSGAAPLPLALVPLSASQRRSFRMAAMDRLLAVRSTCPGDAVSVVRTSVIARMTLQPGAEGNIWEAVRTHILAEYKASQVGGGGVGPGTRLRQAKEPYAGHPGHELALGVLYQLFAGTGVPRSTDAEEGRVEYKGFLLSLLESLIQQQPPSDRAMQQLLCEAPAVPQAALALVGSLCRGQPGDGTPSPSSERTMQGLSTLLALILFRPPLRARCLQMALEMTTHPEEDLRNRAIRLVANRLYQVPKLAAPTEAFAKQQLQALLAEPPSPEPPAGELAPAGQGGGATPAAPPAASAMPAPSPDIAGSGPNPVAAAQRALGLLFALCKKKVELLAELFRAFPAAPKPVRQAMLRQLPALVRLEANESAVGQPEAPGGMSPALLALVQEPPPGSEPFLLKALHCLAEQGSPSVELIAAVKALYASRPQDVELLIPVLPWLSQEEVLPILPRLLELPPPKFKAALDRILQGSAHSGPALTPAEVLIALHRIDSARDGVPLKKVMEACSICMQQRNVFSHQVLAKALNQLVEQTPLPLLFMRTVLQAVGSFPQLTSFVVDLLGRLVTKQIWKEHSKVWEGFVKCASQTAPHSFPLLLQLPAAQLEDAIAQQPSLRGPLADHAAQPAVRSSLPRALVVLLEGQDPSAPQPTSAAVPAA